LDDGARDPPTRAVALTSVAVALAVSVTAPAATDSPVAEAARNLSSGERVHVAENGPEVSEETLALARARILEARTPVRGAFLEGVDPASAVHTLAEQAEEPGLYVVANEERASTGSVTTTLSWTAVGTVTGGDRELDTAVLFGLDHDSARDSVDGLLDQLGDDSALSADTPGFVVRAPWQLWAVPGLLFSLVVTALGLAGSRRRRRALAVRERERRAAEREDAETMAELRAEEAARVTAIQAENDRGITELGESLARAEPPVTDSVAEFETHLREYEKLKEDNERANDIDRVLAIRLRTEQARDRLERWNSRRRGR
jgi:intein/homing endonuclease